MRTVTYAQALNEALREAVEADSKVVLFGEDIGQYGGVFGVTRGIIDAYPQNVVDTPISEAGFIGLAIGAAAEGYRPVVEVMWIDFAMVAMDQIVNQAAKLKYMSGGQMQVPLVIRTQQGAGRGNGAQHSQSLEAMFAGVPGLKVVVPSSAYDAKGLLASAILDPDPVMFIEHKLLYQTRGEIPDKPYTIPLGRAARVVEGSDVTLVSLSRMVHFCQQAAEQLSEEGVSIEVIDLRTLVPLDVATVLESVRRTGRLVLVQEAPRSFGWAAELAAQIGEACWADLLAPIMRVATPDVPFPYNRSLEAAVMPSVPKIVQAVRQALSAEA